VISGSDFSGKLCEEKIENIDIRAVNRAKTGVPL